MKYVFICRLGHDRSPTAASVVRRIAKQRGIDLETESAGLREETRLSIAEKVRDANRLFVMEPDMVEDIRHLPIPYNGEVICLDIIDSYRYMNLRLVEILEEKLNPFLQPSLE